MQLGALTKLLRCCANHVGILCAACILINFSVACELLNLQAQIRAKPLLPFFDFLLHFGGIRSASGVS